MNPTRLLTLAAPALFATVAYAGTTPGVEISSFYAPSAGSDYSGHSGWGVSGAVTAVYDFPDSKYGEQMLGQFEGIFVHTAGTNSIGGPSHSETLDAGFAMLNIGLGARRQAFSCAIFVGMGFGTGSLTGATASKDLALDCALQIKPRVTWHFAKNWALFAEYRHLRTADLANNFFSSSDDRALALNTIGLGVSYSF